METKKLIKTLGKIENFIFEMPQQSSTFKSKIKNGEQRRIYTNLHLDLASHLLSFVQYFFNQMPVAVNSFETGIKVIFKMHLLG